MPTAPDTVSASGVVRSGRRRCPKCRRRLSRFAIRCSHCAWMAPYGQAVILSVALFVALAVAGIVVGVQKYLAGQESSSGVTFGRTGKKG